MKKVLLLILFLSSAVCHAVEDYVWHTPSLDSSESMPLGGGDIGMNVWVDIETNEVKCLFCQSGCFDENNTLLKGGLLRISLEDAREAFVEQRLCLDKGLMKIKFAHTEISLWVDVWKPVIHIDANNPVKLVYDSWRKEDTPLNRFVCQQTSWKWILPKGSYTYKDSIRQENSASTLFFHQNRNDSIVRFTLRQQGLLAFADSIYNPVKNRIFGGRTFPLTKTNAQGFSSHWAVALCNQQSSLDDWEKALAKISSSIDLNKDKKASQNWWKQFWERSFIKSNGKAKEALRNYALFRFMLGCNAHPSPEGERWPTKFNGGLFTFNPADCDTLMENYAHDHPEIVTPDYRRWGGGVHTAQNQRLVYWPMLQTGDWDALQCQLDFYSRILHTAELRTQYYWNHGGACFTEQIENFGLPNPAEYGKKRVGGEPGVEDNRWLEYEWDTALEFADMYCNYPFKLSPIGEQKARESARKMILSCLRFFDEHYEESDSAGNMIIYPGSACETFKITRNASSTIAALLRVSSDAIEHANNLQLSNQEITWLKRFKAQLPPIPTYQMEGKTCIAPAESWRYIKNVETPQLYPVWPWRVVRGELAHNTYSSDSITQAHRSSIGWKQDNIWAAMVGESEDAWDMTMTKLVVKEPNRNSNVYRFPAFWGPGFDWMPDHNWGGSAIVGLHAMLLQEDEKGNIILLPSWPKDQDVHFRLWASKNRLVEVIYSKRKIVKYTINGKAQN